MAGKSGMKNLLGTAIVVLLCAAAGAAGPSPDFARYQVILDRKPFGEAPPPEMLPVTIPPEQSFARNYRMSALLEMEDGTVKIGLIDVQKNTSFFLAPGDVEEGVELVSADYDAEEAIIRKGPEMAVIKLQSGDIQPLTPAEQQARLNAPPSRRPSYAERRRARMEARQREPPKPLYTGEELEQHLQEYQMDVIRQGLPPLPIPLTPEMDDQLVQEGVLPPME